MDTQDVSLDDRIAQLFKQAAASAERAIRRKGETPTDHIPPFLQVQTHMIEHYARPWAVDEQYKLITTHIPPAYPPCTLSVAELDAILISEMKLETHHRGRMAIVRSLVPPNRMNAVMAIVEDAEGTAALLQVYHQPEESVVPTEETLREGGIYLLKEPYFKTANSERIYSLRVDHVGDIWELADGDDLIPVKWRKSNTIAGTSQSIRTLGNAAVSKKRWAEAERL